MPGSRPASRESLRATALLPGPVRGNSESPAGSQGDTQTPRWQVCCVPTATRTCSALTVKGKEQQWAAAAQHHRSPNSHDQRKHLETSVTALALPKPHRHCSENSSHKQEHCQEHCPGKNKAFHSQE